MGADTKTIVERLRSPYIRRAWNEEAAAEIERLQARVKELEGVRAKTIQECAAIAQRYELEAWGMTEERAAASVIGERICSLVQGDATNSDFYAELAKFFREQFQDDPIGVGDWLAQGGTDVEDFLAELDRAHPADRYQSPSSGE